MIRITGYRENVALYDSSTGIAFGEVFRSDEVAAAFLDWLDEEGHADARTHTPQALALLRDAWTQQLISGRSETEE